MTQFAVSPQEKVETQRQRFRLEFEKHRGFLAQEEQLQLRRLEEEERATLQRLRDCRNRLVQQNKALKELAEELQERSQRPALGLLEVRQALENRVGGGAGGGKADVRLRDRGEILSSGYQHPAMLGMLALSRPT